MDQTYRLQNGAKQDIRHNEKADSKGAAKPYVSVMGNAEACRFMDMQNELVTASGNSAMYESSRRKDGGVSEMALEGSGFSIQRMQEGENTPIQRQPGVAEWYLEQARAEYQRGQILANQAARLQQQVAGMFAQMQQNPNNPMNEQIVQQTQALLQQASILSCQAREALQRSEQFRQQNVELSDMHSEAPSGRNSDDEDGSGNFYL